MSDASKLPIRSLVSVTRYTRYGRLEISNATSNRLAQCDPHVLDGVVRIDSEVAFGSNPQIECTVSREGLEHVIKKGDSGGDVVLARSVQVEFDVDFGFLRFALH